MATTPQSHHTQYNDHDSQFFSIHSASLIHTVSVCSLLFINMFIELIKI